MSVEHGIPGYVDQQRDVFLRSVIRQEALSNTVPAHMKYPRVWEFLEGPNPFLLLDYLKWLHADEERFTSAAEHMEWFEVGFHALPLVIVPDTASNIPVSSIQANFYTEEFPGNEHAHAHSRNAKVVLYEHPDSRQTTSQSLLLPQGTRPVTDLSINSSLIVVNCLTPRNNGQSAIYDPLIVGEGYIAHIVTTAKTPLTEEIFNSTGVHKVSYEGPGVAVSIHVKGRTESRGLNNLQGLTTFKGLTLPQAELVEAHSPWTGAPRTLIFPGLDFKPESLSPTRLPTSRQTAERLLHGALHTAERLVKMA